MGSASHVWHYELHQTVAAERLYVLAVRFTHGYDRALACTQLDRALADARVQSYVVWEMIGYHDILIKLWLPPNVDIADLETELLSRVVGPHHITIEAFDIDSTLFHHLWTAAPPDAHQIPHWHFIEINGENPPPQTVLHRYVAQRYLAKPRYGKSIKFFTFLPDDRSGALGEHDLPSRLAELARRQRGIDKLSIFQGGNFARFLISGRVKPADWNALTDLTDALNELNVTRHGGTRSVTHISAFPEPILRRERLLEAPNSAPPLSSLLERGPSHELDFVLSALDDARREPQPATKAAVRDGFLYALVSFLNTTGGHLVLGVGDARDHALSVVSQNNPLAREQSGRIVVGVDHEMPQGSWPLYERTLRRLMSAHVEPDPLRWLSIRSVADESGTIVVIAMRRPDCWHYVKPIGAPGQIRFVGRLNNKPEALAGTEMDSYRARYPRTTRRIS